MGWSYPDISLEDLMKLIKNFVDMLILASGYQSTGRLAHWDSHNIKRSFHWALFLEKVSKGLMSSSDYEDCVQELDAALFELTSNPHFPQGLAHLSCTTLVKARDFLLEHLIQTLPLRESHLKSIMLSCVEMDFLELQRIDDDCIVAYLEKLTSAPQNLNLNQDGKFKESEIAFPDGVPGIKHRDLVDGDFSLSAIQQLRRRQLAVSCSSVVENGLELVSKTIGLSMEDEFGIASSGERIKQSECLIVEELAVDWIVWNRWRSRSLSYMLDRRTMRLTSGASLIFSVPEDQWAQVFERLKIASESDDLCEIIEIILFGCVADRWSSLTAHLMSVSYESIPVSRLYQEVLNLPQGNALTFCLKEGFMSPKEKSIVDYLEVLLSNHLSQLWKLSPVLAAVAIPSQSQLFRSYLREIEGQFIGNCMLTRRCSCIADETDHRECEMVERLWCLYMFHICKSDTASRRTTGA